MIVKKEKTAAGTTVFISGRLDTTTAPQLEEELKDVLAETNALTFDLDGLEYISSAGLRILLSAQKVMNKRGTMVIRHANETALEVFELTGFTDILTIEES